EVTEGHGLAHRAPGDDRDRADALGQLDEDLRGVGVDVRLLRVLHDRGQGAVEVEADHRAVGGRNQVVVPATWQAAGELHASEPTTCHPALSMRAAVVPARPVTLVLL